MGMAGLGHLVETLPVTPEIQPDPFKVPEPLLRHLPHSVRLQKAPTAASRLDALPLPEQRVYTLLQRLVIAHARSHGRKMTPVYVIHSSAELMQDALNMGHTRFYEALKRLREAKLVMQRGFVERLESRAVMSGTLFAVVTDPTSDIEARFRWWDWKHQYRNMAEAIRTGKTVWKMRTGDTEIPQGSEMRYQILESFTLFGHLKQNSVDASVFPQSPEPVSDREFLYSLGDLLQVHWTARASWIDQAAGRLASIFTDHRSLNLYRWILWSALKAHQQGRDILQLVVNILLNVLGDQQDDIPTNWGRVIIGKLKVMGLWDDLKATAG